MDIITQPLVLQHFLGSTLASSLGYFAISQIKTNILHASVPISLVLQRSYSFLSPRKKYSAY